MLTPRPAFALSALTLALAACGARSDLLGARSGATSSVGSGGVGAASATVGSGASVASSTGTGGAGGPTCVGLTMSGPEALTPAGLADGVRRPALVALDGQNASAALVVGMDPLEGSGPFGAIGHVGLTPWGAWPPALDTLHQAVPAGGPSFAVAPGGAGVYSLLLPGAFGQVSGMAHDWAVDANGQAMPELFDATVDVALFVSSSGSRHVVGYDGAQPPGRVLVASLFDGDTPLTGVFGLVCSNDPIVADAIPLGDGFLIAAAQNPPFANCPPSDENPATEVDLFVASPDAPFSPMSQLPGDEKIAGVKLVPASGGGFLLVQRAGQDKGPEAVVARHLGSDGELANDPFDAVPSGRGARHKAPKVKGGR